MKSDPPFVTLIDGDAMRKMRDRGLRCIAMQRKAIVKPVRLYSRAYEVGNILIPFA